MSGAILGFMTTAETSVAGLRERAAQVSPGQVLVTCGQFLVAAIAWVLAAIGWVTGATWRLLVFLALLSWHKVLVFGARSVRYGYWKGLGLTEKQIMERVKVPGEKAA